MPNRRSPIVVGEIYHIFNRSVARQPVFLNQSDYQRALEIVQFYSYSKPGLRFSHYKRLPAEVRGDFLANLKLGSNKRICLLAFCLMPNHFHFLVKETAEGGIISFMKDFQNSYARYFNTKERRNGALFQSQFKSVRIESDEQLVHVGRYIHLNPLTSYVLHDPFELGRYAWSSFIDYTGGRDEDLVDKTMLSSFLPSVDDFKKFTFDQVDYQRELDQIRHLTFE